MFHVLQMPRFAELAGYAQAAAHDELSKLTAQRALEEFLKLPALRRKSWHEPEKLPVEGLYPGPRRSMAFWP